jgi:hypothetical protein
VQKQVADLLPVPYFHVVFTMPPAVASVAMQNQKVVYDILFRAAAQTIQMIASTPKHLGAEVGLLAVLHTWGQNLHYHPHVHCVAPGGGLSFDGDRWVPSRDKFFLPVRVLSRLYRRLFLSFLDQAYRDGRLTFHDSLAELENKEAFDDHLAEAREVEWVVYTKAPFGGPEQVLAYVGRYTHRVAISNNRLLKLEDGRVSFLWKDYRDGNTQKVMTLAAHDFISRYVQHILPKGFVRIRSYGILSTRNRPTKLARCRELLKAPAPAPVAETWKDQLEKLTGQSIDECPACKQGQMKIVRMVPSIRELQENCTLSHYDPRLLLSRLQATCWLNRLGRLRRLVVFDTS